MNTATLNLAGMAAGGGLPAIRTIAYMVASESGGEGLTYCIRADRAAGGWTWRCNCPDYTQRAIKNTNHICKHMHDVISAAIAAGVAAAAAAAQATAWIVDVAECAESYRAACLDNAGGASCSDFIPGADDEPPAPAAAPTAPPPPPSPRAAAAITDWLLNDTTIEVGSGVHHTGINDTECPRCLGRKRPGYAECYRCRAAAGATPMRPRGGATTAAELYA